MSDASASKLEQAYNLIREEKLDDAAAILQPILFSEPENADAWWLWANTVTEPEDARHALGKVLEYAPEHQAAKEMLQGLNELYPPVPEAQAGLFEFGQAEDFDDLLSDTSVEETVSPDIPEVVPPEEAVAEPVIRRLEPAAASDSESASEAIDFGSLFDIEADEIEEELPDFEDTPDFDEAMEPAEAAATSAEKPRRRPLLRLVLVLLIAVFVVAAVAILLSNSGQAGVPGQDVAQVPGSGVELPSSADQSIEPDESVAIVVEALQSAANAQTALLGGPATVTFVRREGQTAIVLSVCRAAGPDISAALDVAMDMAARLTLSVQEEVELIAADFINCDRADKLLSAAAPIDQAAAYANGNLIREEFRATWVW